MRAPPRVCRSRHSISPAKAPAMAFNDARLAMLGLTVWRSLCCALWCSCRSRLCLQWSGQSIWRGHQWQHSAGCRGWRVVRPASSGSGADGHRRGRLHRLAAAADQPLVGRDQRHVRIDEDPAVARRHLHVEMQVIGRAALAAAVIADRADHFAFARRHGR